MPSRSERTQAAFPNQVSQALLQRERHPSTGDHGVYLSRGFLPSSPKYSCGLYDLSHSFRNISGQDHDFFARPIEKVQPHGNLVGERLRMVGLAAKVGVHQTRTIRMRRIAVLSTESNKNRINFPEEFG